MNTSSELQFKLLLMGGDCEKTQFLLRACGCSYSPVVAKIVEFTTKVLHVGEKRIKLQIWDAVGQESYRVVTNPTYFRGAQGIIFTFSVHDRDSFVSCQKWIRHAKIFGQSSVISALVGLKESDSPVIVREEEARSLARNLKMKYYPLNPRESSNEDIDSVFQDVASLIKSQSLLEQLEFSITNGLLLATINSWKIVAQHIEFEVIVKLLSPHTLDTWLADNVTLAHPSLLPSWNYQLRFYRRYSQFLELYSQLKACAVTVCRSTLPTAGKTHQSQALSPNASPFKAARPQTSSVDGPSPAKDKDRDRDRERVRSISSSSTTSRQSIGSLQQLSSLANLPTSTSASASSSTLATTTQQQQATMGVICTSLPAPPHKQLLPRLFHRWRSEAFLQRRRVGLDHWVSEVCLVTHSLQPRARQALRSFITVDMADDCSDHNSMIDWARPSDSMCMELSPHATYLADS